MVFANASERSIRLMLKQHILSPDALEKEILSVEASLAQPLRTSAEGMCGSNETTYAVTATRNKIECGEEITCGNWRSLGSGLFTRHVGLQGARVAAAVLATILRRSPKEHTAA